MTRKSWKQRVKEAEAYVGLMSIESLINLEYPPFSTLKEMVDWSEREGARGDAEI